MTRTLLRAKTGTIDDERLVPMLWFASNIDKLPSSLSFTKVTYVHRR